MICEWRYVCKFLLLLLVFRKRQKLEDYGRGYYIQEWMRSDWYEEEADSSSCKGSLLHVSQ